MLQIAENIRKLMTGLIQTFLYPALEVLRTQCVEIVRSIDSALVLKFLELLDFRLRPLTGKDDRPPPAPPFLALMREFVFVFFSFMAWTPNLFIKLHSRAMKYSSDSATFLVVGSFHSSRVYNIISGS